MNAIERQIHAPSKKSQNVMRRLFIRDAAGFDCGHISVHVLRLLQSDLAVLINVVTRIDEEKRARALKSLRDAGFRQRLDACSDVLPKGSTALDVGCAHGWFIEAARARGYLAVGIEPDVEIANRARAIGVELTVGLFPDALPENLTFDAITFNDVFEHLPDVNAMLRSTYNRVNPAAWSSLRCQCLTDLFQSRAPRGPDWNQGSAGTHVAEGPAVASSQLLFAQDIASRDEKNGPKRHQAWAGPSHHGSESLRSNSLRSQRRQSESRNHIHGRAGCLAHCACVPVRYPLFIFRKA